MYLTENWRLKEQRYTLVGNQNKDQVNFPPRPVEPRQVETYDFSEDKALPQTELQLEIA